MKNVPIAYFYKRQSRDLSTELRMHIQSKYLLCCKAFIEWLGSDTCCVTELQVNVIKNSDDTRFLIDMHIGSDRQRVIHKYICAMPKHLISLVASPMISYLFLSLKT